MNNFIINGSRFIFLIIETILLIILFRLIFILLLLLRMRSIVVKFFNLTFIFLKNSFFYSCSCNPPILVRERTVRSNMTWLIAVKAYNWVVCFRSSLIRIALGGSIYSITQFYWVSTICGIIISHIFPPCQQQLSCRLVLDSITSRSMLFIRTSILITTPIQSSWLL